LAYIQARDPDFGGRDRVDCTVLDNSNLSLRRLTPTDDHRPPLGDGYPVNNDFLLSLEAPIDRETTQMLVARIHCTDEAKNPSDKLIRIRVLDINDEAPTFLWPIFYFSVKENRKLNSGGRAAQNSTSKILQGYRIGRVIAYDRDQGDNANIMYQLLPQLEISQPVGRPSFLPQPDSPRDLFMHKATDLFQMDSFTGELFALRSFDAEQIEIIKFQVIAVDQPTAPDSISHTGTASVHVRIVDVNDWSPIFFKTNDKEFTAVGYSINDSDGITLVDSYVFSVPENKPAYTIVGRIGVLDPDVSFWANANTTLEGSGSKNPHLPRISLRFASDTSTHIKDAFSIHTTTGQIRTVHPLDRETYANYSFSIVATDKGSEDRLSRTSTVAVTVIVECYVKLKAEACMRTIQKQRYLRVLGGNENQEEEASKRAGRTSKQADPAMRAPSCDSHATLARAIHAHSPPQTAPGQAFASFSTGLRWDENDNNPVFVRPSPVSGNTYEQRERSSASSTPREISKVPKQSEAIDGDDTESFSVDSQGPTPPDKDQILVVAVQRVSMPMTGDGEEAPLQNGDSNGRPLIRVEAHDPDAGLNGEIRYSIASGNVDDIFYLDASSGSLFLKSPNLLRRPSLPMKSSVLNMEPEFSYLLRLEACDMGTPKRCATPAWLRMVMDYPSPAMGGLGFPKVWSDSQDSSQHYTHSGSHPYIDANMQPLSGGDRSNYPSRTAGQWPPYMERWGQLRSPVKQNEYVKDWRLHNRGLSNGKVGDFLMDERHYDSRRSVVSASEAVIICLAVIFAVLLCAALALVYLVKRRSIYFSVTGRQKNKTNFLEGDTFIVAPVAGFYDYDFQGLDPSDKASLYRMVADTRAPGKIVFVDNNFDRQSLPEGAASDEFALSPVVKRAGAAENTLEALTVHGLVFVNLPTPTTALPEAAFVIYKRLAALTPTTKTDRLPDRLLMSAKGPPICTKITDIPWVCVPFFCVAGGKRLAVQDYSLRRGLSASAAVLTNMESVYISPGAESVMEASDYPELVSRSTITFNHPHMASYHREGSNIQNFVNPDTGQTMVFGTIVGPNAATQTVRYGAAAAAATAAASSGYASPPQRTMGDYVAADVATDVATFQRRCASLKPRHYMNANPYRYIQPPGAYVYGSVMSNPSRGEMQHFRGLSEPIPANNQVAYSPHGAFFCPPEDAHTYHDIDIFAATLQRQRRLGGHPLEQVAEVAPTNFQPSSPYGQLRQLPLVPQPVSGSRYATLATRAAPDDEVQARMASMTLKRPLVQHESIQQQRKQQKQGASQQASVTDLDTSASEQTTNFNVERETTRSSNSLADAYMDADAVDSTTDPKAKLLNSTEESFSNDRTLTPRRPRSGGVAGGPTSPEEGGVPAVSANEVSSGFATLKAFTSKNSQNQTYAVHAYHEASFV
uniref:Cadherin domain protein n=1 Tax=Schistocephalus solidus TaxID=70667 RepID=A0A183SHL5_SCHSO